VLLSGTQRSFEAFDLVWKQGGYPPVFVRNEPDDVPSERNGIVLDLEPRNANSRVPLRRSDDNAPALLQRHSTSGAKR
jgi:hypothetical protein